MSTIFQAWHRRQHLAWRGSLLLAGIAIGLGQVAVAHDILGAFIQHSVRLSVGARYIDLQVDLTFFEEWSARERAGMDTDGNGRVTRSEVEAYLKKLAPALAEGVKLRIAGAELALAPLYEPEVDLLGTDQVGPAHHRLRLFFFAPSPKSLHAGDAIVIEDRLWPATKALGLLQVQGSDDCRLETAESSDLIFAPAVAGEARLFKVSCLNPPQAKAGKPVISYTRPEPIPLPASRASASSPNSANFAQP